MKLSVVLLALTSLSVLAPVAKADTIDQYSFSVYIDSYSPNFYGNTYTGMFQVDEQTGDVTNFSTNLLGGSYTNPNVGNVATFTNGVVSSLSFGLTIQGAEGSHSSGFTTGFSSQQVGNQNNYFAFLDPQNYFEGEGTPVFTLESTTTAATPEPSSFLLLASGIFGIGGARLKSRFAQAANKFKG